MSEHLLDVQNLRVSFDTYAGEVQAVRGVSFYIDKGETLAIVGESGCGKSVSIQTVMGLLPMPPARIKEGHIYYEGKDLTTLTDKQMENYRGKEFSMIFQDSMTSLNPTMRVGRQMVEATWSIRRSAGKRPGTRPSASWKSRSARTRKRYLNGIPTPCPAVSVSV